MPRLASLSPDTPRSYASSPTFSPLLSRSKAETTRLLEGPDSSPLQHYEDDSFEYTPIQQPVFPVPRRKTRIHPLTLLPAFLLGLALSYAYLQPLRLPKRLEIPLTRHESGLVFLDPSAYVRAEEAGATRATAEHPIHTLIREAEEQWHAKHRRRSKTLGEAVAEYKRRYERPPPRGFDRWYHFAKEHGVIFLDEYDSLHANLELYWAIPPHILRRRQDALARQSRDAQDKTFTFNVRNGSFFVTGELGDQEPRIVDHMALCSPFADQLEDVTLVFTYEDRPRVLIDYAQRQRHLQAAKERRVLTEEEAEMVDDDLGWWGFQLACAPDSRLRRATNGLEIESLPVGAGFIGTDHIQAMDICANPEWKNLHGYTWTRGLRPQAVDPITAFAKVTLDADILVPGLEQYFDEAPSDPAWADKTINKAVWRGSSTVRWLSCFFEPVRARAQGLHYNGTTPWRSAQRARLHFLARDQLGSRRVRFTDEHDRVFERVERHADLSEQYLDVGFARELIQCDTDCEALSKHIDFMPELSWEAHNDYKYLIDVDGNAWSGRFHRLMRSNSLVLKSTIFPPWYRETIQPWYHYVPVRIDYSDLFDIMSFFAGDLDGKNGHDDFAERIAAQGKLWTDEHFRKEDLQALFRLYLEWARLLAGDRPSMDYQEG